VDHREACGSRHVAGGRWWTAVDGDPRGRRRQLREQLLPTLLTGDLGYNRVLEEEESTTVLRVGSDSEGGG
jgi:hypothetical protein